MVKPSGSNGPNEGNSRHDCLPSEWSEYHLQQPLPRGIPNPGVLCYRNSALITLLHAPVVVNWFFLHFEHMDKPITDEEGCMVCLPCFFRVFFEEYWLHRESHLAMWIHLHYVSSTINLLIGYKDEDLKKEQDVVEYLTYVLNILSNQTLESDKPYMVQDIFQHRLEYQITCEECLHTKPYGPPDPGFFLGAAIDGKQQRTIEQAIDRYLFCPNDAFDWSCESCNGKNKSARRGVILDAPEILFVHVNRFTGERKLKTSVIFEELLDITEHYVAKPEEDSNQKLRYQLFAVIYHRGGSISEGHYYTYALGPTGKWSSINDHIVKETSFAGVRKAQSNDDCVYVLAYRRKSTMDRSALCAEADGQPQTTEDTAQIGAQAASGERSVDVRAQINIDERTLIGDLGGWLTLPGTRPLVNLGQRKRVQPATVTIDMTMGGSKLVGTIGGNLKPEQKVPPDQSSHPSTTASEITPSQLVPSQPALPQEPAAQETSPQRTGSNPHILKLNGPKPPIPMEASKKRKRDQVEESQDPQEFGEPAPSTKRQKPGRKQKANKGGKSRNKKKNNRNQKKGSGGKLKGGKGHQKTNEGNEASAAANAGNGQLGPADRAHEPTKARQKLTLKLRNSDVQARAPVVYPEENPEEHRREYQEDVLEEYKRGGQGSSGVYLQGDLVHPPPQPPVQPPAQMKPQGPPKPPPREGTRKNPPRNGKK